MRKLLMTALAGAAVAASTPALATNPPTLHGYCTTAGPSSVCVDNGVFTPESANPPSFGFTASPGSNATGTLLVDILIPNNDSNAGSYSISGAKSGTATLFSTTAWTTGSLEQYLGISASPTNPIGAWLPSTQGLDPGATGFWVFQANLGLVTLPGNSGPTFPISTLGSNVPLGTYIVGFLNQGDAGIGATANSGALLETGGLPEPATWAMMLLGFGGIGMALRRSRRRNSTLLQVA